MNISIKNVDSVMARLRSAVSGNLDEQYKDKIDTRFKALVLVSPQWSGDLASNWRISLTPEGTYQRWAGKHENYRQQGFMVERGDPAAPLFAIDASRDVVYTYKDKVYFTNATPLSFTATTVTSDDDGVTQKVRPENLINGAVAMISYIKARYPN